MSAIFKGICVSINGAAVLKKTNSRANPRLFKLIFFKLTFFKLTFSKLIQGAVMKILKLLTLTTILSTPVLAVAQPPDHAQGQQARQAQGTMMNEHSGKCKR
jgi:hypothetical protein